MNDTTTLSGPRFIGPLDYIRAHYDMRGVLARLAREYGDPFLVPNPAGPMAFTGHPAMECEHALMIVTMDDAKASAAEARTRPALLNQLTREAQVSEHLSIAVLETRPVQEQIRMDVGVVRPGLVLEELLTHEQHRDAGRRETDRGGHPRTAATEP